MSGGLPPSLRTNKPEPYTLKLGTRHYSRARYGAASVQKHQEHGLAHDSQVDTLIPWYKPVNLGSVSGTRHYSRAKYSQSRSILKLTPWVRVIDPSTLECVTLNPKPYSPLQIHGATAPPAGS